MKENQSDRKRERKMGKRVEKSFDKSVVRSVRLGDLQLKSLWVVSFLLIFVTNLLMGWGKELRWGDAGDYFNLGVSLWNKGRFSFLNMPTGFRGYVFPLYLGICDKAGGMTCYKLVNALLVAFLFMKLFPLLNGEKKEAGMKKRCAVSLLAYAIFSFFFYGLEIYPLTDLPAIMLFMAAVVLKNKIMEDGGSVRQAVFGFLLGVMLYLVYNVRTIYMFAGFYLAIVLGVGLLRSGRKLLQKLIPIVLMLCGVGIAGIPQAYMNYHQLGIFSIKVPTSDLMLKQIYWGIQYQRYDTAGFEFKQMEQHPSYGMYFVDTVGQGLLDKYGIEEFSSWAEVIRFFLKNPIEVAGIYTRHLVNMLFPCWPNQYVEDMDSNKILIALFAYIFFFLFGLVVLNKCSRAERNIWVNYSALLVPVLFILPGAVEARFFASLYLVVLGVLCYHTDWTKVRRYVSTEKWKAAALFFVMGLIILSCWTNMLASESAYRIFFT